MMPMRAGRANAVRGQGGWTRRWALAASRSWSSARAGAARSAASACASRRAEEEAAVRACVLAMLAQEQALLFAVDDAQYVYTSALVGGSVGQHTRHALDHLRKPLEVFHAAQDQQPQDEEAPALRVIRYDLRTRNTLVEHEREAARRQIDEIRDNLLTLPPSALRQPVQGAFMLSADGAQVAFESTLSRELGFAVHHAIHHNAMIKVLLRHHFPHVELPAQFGMAPSTAHFQQTQAEPLAK